MVYNKTAWKDRVVERPLTFTQQNNADGTVTLVPAEGQIIEPGTSINAVNMNNIEKQYDEAVAWAKGFGLGADAAYLGANPTVTNADNLAVTGMYVTRDTFTGSPIAGTSGGNQGYLEHRQWVNPNYAIQIHTQINATKVRRIRYKDNGVWGNWQELLSDAPSIWTNLTLQNGATAIAPQYPLQYTKIGNIVHLRGQLNGTLNYATVFATLPVGYRPLQDFIYKCAVNSADSTLSAHITCAATGNLTLTGKGSSGGIFIQTSFVTGS